MRTLGIDLGIHKIAMAVLEGDELIHVYVHPSESGIRDIQLYELGVVAHGIALEHDMDSAWIEDIIIGNNRKYSIQLAETKGAVMASLGRLRPTLDVRVVDNQTWKKQVVGSGHATKDEVKNYIHESHPAYAPLCGDDQDLYDASCIGLYGLHVTGQARALQL